MEAPKKLFIKPEKIKVEMIPGGVLPNVGIQYIRKDLLIEWAKQKQYESTTIVADNFWQEVIDKIESI